MLPTLLVPFRQQVEQERGEHLKKFVSHMSRYHPDWTVLIIEQSNDNKKFNRGALLNIGTKYAEKAGASYIIYHDVDLIPLSPLVKYYTAFPEEPIHIGTAYKDKYANDTFIGQALSISLKDAKKINGFPNQFWGWGGEDDAMYRRLKRHGINIIKPPISKGFKVLEHIDTRKIADAKNMRKWEDLKEDTGRSGLSNIQWKLLDEKRVGNIVKYTVEIA
jgi:hypothetical protein